MIKQSQMGQTKSTQPFTLGRTIQLVLLPGMDGTGELFSAFVEMFSDAYEITIVHYPSDQPYNYDELRAVARQSLPATGSFLLLGESFSGPIAISLAAEFKDRVMGLILCCTFAKNPRPKLVYPLVAFLPIAHIPSKLMEIALMGSYSTVGLNSLLRSTMAKVSPHVIRARLLAVLSVNVTSQLATLRMPVLYLRAKYDRVVPEQSLSVVQHFCPHVKVVLINAPHFLLQVVPREAANAVQSFAQSIQNVSQ